MLAAEMVALRYRPGGLLETDWRVPSALPMDKKGLCPLLYFVGPFCEMQNEVPALDAAGQGAITGSLYRLDGNVAVALAVSVHNGHLGSGDASLALAKLFESEGRPFIGCGEAGEFSAGLPKAVINVVFRRCGS
jgi:hypothetical protein